MYSFGLRAPHSKYGSYGFQKRAEKNTQDNPQRKVYTPKKKNYTAVTTIGLVIASAVLAYKGKDKISNVLVHAKKFISEKGGKLSKKFPNISAGVKSFGTALNNGKNAILHPFKK